MRIEWNLDKEEPIDLQSLLGDLQILSGESSISIKDTYIDSWFVALIRSIQELHWEKNIEVKVIEEPTPILIESQKDRLEIIFIDERITISSIHELNDALKLASMRFLQELGEIKNIEGYPMLKEIQEFLHLHR